MNCCKDIEPHLNPITKYVCEERWKQHALSRVWRHVVPATIPWKHYNKKIEFSVVSYNILSQLLLENNKYLYRGISNNYLKSDRFQLIIKELESYDADIVCIQEFDHQNREIFASHFGPKGFDNIYQRKPHIPYQEKDDGCFMMYRKEKFKLIKDASLGLFKSSEGLLDKPNCAQIALFECSDGSQLCVANTHLLYNPRRGDIKLAQLSLILHHIQQTVNPLQQCGGVPVVFCGDFNTCPSAPLYNLLKYGKLQYSEFTPDKISGQKGFKKLHKVAPGLWNDKEMGFHEHGLVKRDENELAQCRETYRSLSQGSSLLAQSFRDLECSKCSDLYPYKQGSISHNINFRSAYDHIDSDGKTKEVTTYIQNDARTVDYIWYSNHDNTPQNCAHGHSCDPHCSSSVLTLKSKRRLLTKPELFNMGRLPNAILGSDHQALHASFTMHSEPVPNSSGRN
ncbi:hypothetical protein ACHWQZ_G017431 [Mnemiopsis leidyi]